MKPRLPYLLLALAATGGLWISLPTPLPAQAADEDPALVALVADIVAQQAALQANHDKIDEKIAAIAEDVRQSRLFAARGGNRK
jgi:hypothetical protein